MMKANIVISKFCQTCGFGFVILSLILAIVAFVNPKLIYYYANSSERPSTWIQFNRSRGMLQECLSDADVVKKVPVIEYPYYINEQKCIMNDLGQYNMPYDLQYSIVIKVRQAQIGFHSAGILLLLIVAIMGIFLYFKSCKTKVEDKVFIKWKMAMTVLSLLILLCLSVSCSVLTALFHYFEYEKKFKTNNLPFSQFNLYNVQRYGTTYYLAWISVGFSGISTILFFLSVHFEMREQNKRYNNDCISFDNPSFQKNIFTESNPIFLTPSISIFGDYQKSRNNTDKLYVQNPYCDTRSLPNIPNMTPSPNVLPRINLENIELEQNI